VNSVLADGDDVALLEECARLAQRAAVHVVVGQHPLAGTIKLCNFEAGATVVCGREHGDLVGHAVWDVLRHCCMVRW
jgi:hypothetical protein